MREVEWTKRELVPQLHERHPNALFYDTSTNAPLAHDLDYVIDAREFSPFIPYGSIPIPGRKGTSDSVEGVWQGLKLIKGKTDESYFEGKGRKRAGKPKGHLFGNQVLGYREARTRIYVPSYHYMFEHCVPRETIQQIADRATNDKQQFFFDVDSNPDIHNLSSPLSHAAVLVDLINNYLRPK